MFFMFRYYRKKINKVDVFEEYINLTLNKISINSLLLNNIKKEIVDPYISIKDSEARISLRIKDSLDNLRRNDLLIKINSDLENKLDLKKGDVLVFPSMMHHRVNPILSGERRVLVAWAWGPLYK